MLIETEEHQFCLASMNDALKKAPLWQVTYGAFNGTASKTAYASVSIRPKGASDQMTALDARKPIVPAQVASRLWNLGVDEVALGETLGRGTPDRVNTMVNAVLKYVPAAHVAGHFHDTAGRALANIDVCLDAGLRVFDASAGGLGGCPYAPGAAGNVATKAVRGHVEARGFRTGLDPVTLEQASAFATEIRNANDHS